MRMNQKLTIVYESSLTNLLDYLKIVYHINKLIYAGQMIVFICNNDTLWKVDAASRMPQQDF